MIEGRLNANHPLTIASLQNHLNGEYSQNWIAAFLILLLTLPSLGCQSSTAPDREQTGDALPANRVVATSYALQFLTQRIVGNSVTVDFPAESVSDPKQWQPSVQDISSMQKADLIIVNGQGAPFANWLTQTTLPANKICESCKDIPLKQLISVPDYQIVHSHGPEGEHSHAYMVPNTWLDPKIAARQAKTIADCLTRTYPEKQPTIVDNLNQLLQKLEVISTELATDKPNLNIVTTNPQFKFLTQAAGFDDIHMLWFDSSIKDNLAESIKQLEQLIAKNRPVAVVCAAHPNSELVSLCKKLDVDRVEIELLEVKPATGDFFTAMQQNVNRLTNLRRSSTR